MSHNYIPIDIYNASFIIAQAIFRVVDFFHTPRYQKPPGEATETQAAEVIVGSSTLRRSKFTPHNLVGRQRLFFFAVASRKTYLRWYNSLI
jgi:hypothetical protein